MFCCSKSAKWNGMYKFETKYIDCQGNLIFVILEFLFTECVVNNESVGIGAELSDFSFRNIDILQGSAFV